MKVGTFDIETNGFLPNLDTVWCASVKDAETGERRNFRPSDIADLPAYLDTFDVLRGHNCIQFDFPALRKVLGYEYQGTKVDTLLMSRLQRPNRPRVPNVSAGPHSVEAWGARLGYPKKGHEEWDKFSEDMMTRCATDVDIQELIYGALIAEGKGEGWERAHKLNSKLFHYLQLQEEHGWYVDRAKLDWCLATLNRWIDRIDRAVSARLPIVVEIDESKSAGEYKWVGKPFKKSGEYSKATSDWLDVVSPSAPVKPSVGGPYSRVSFRAVDLDKNLEVRDFLLAQGWKPAEWNTNNVGQHTSPKLSKDDPFEGVIGGLGKLIAKRVQCKQRRGTIEGWHNAIRADGRIPTPVSGLAITGRLRHSLVVNVPSPDAKAFFAKHMRAIFSSPEGKVLVGCDSKGNQIRQLAARMGDDEFTHAVLFGTKEDGTDLHSVNQRRSGVPTRTLAKNFFYGFIFGAGDAKIGKIVGGSAKEGKALKEKYYKELPGLRKLIDNASKEWKATAQRWYNSKWGKMEYRNGFIRGLDGRPIQVDSEHKILVSFLQSDEAIQMAVAYVIFHKWMEKRGYVLGKNFTTVIWYHDEIQVETDPEIAEEVGMLLSEAIRWSGDYLGIACPHEGEYSIGKNWRETH